MSAQDEQTPAPAKALVGLGEFFDDRFRGARSVRTLLKKVFPDHWTFLLGEIALYSFIILLLTGTFLTLFFQPSMTDVVYHGTYTRLDGVHMSEAYASTLNISFDVRGGLLMRQIHHWAADLFMAAIMAHMLRIFFSGAYRKPRDVNWLIGITMFVLGMLEGLFGYSLPDDLLSGTGLRILEGVILGIPIVGTYLSFFLFGGQFPGHDIIPRLYIIHVLLIPGLILGLVSAHLFIMFHQKHTQHAGLGRTEKNVVGAPTYPYFMAKTGAFFFFVFGALALLSTVAQINPIWLYGPYSPVAISAGSQPDFYMGFLEGALRVFPSWTWDLGGHTVAWDVLIPGLVPLGVIFTGAALWPWIERWATGDQAEHHINDRPRNAPTRSAIGMAAVTFYAIMLLEGANDLIAMHLDISLYLTTEIARWAVFLGGPGLLRDQADLPRAAAQGPGTARARGRDRHHQADAGRRVRRAAPAGLRGDAGCPAVPELAAAPARHCRAGRERRSGAGRPQHRRQGPRHRVPGDDREHPAAGRQRARRQRPQRARRRRGRGARRGRRRPAVAPGSRRGRRPARAGRAGPAVRPAARRPRRLTRPGPAPVTGPAPADMETDPGSTEPDTGPGRAATARAARAERVLAASLRVMIIPVVVLILSALGAFGYGLALFVHSVQSVAAHPFPVGHQVGFFLLDIDLFLIGTTLLISAVGLYDLFIRELHARPAVSLPAWLDMHDLNDLKARVIAMIVLVLSVSFAELAVDSTDGRQVLELGTGVALVIVALTIFTRLTGHSNDKTGV